MDINEFGNKQLMKIMKIFLDSPSKEVEQSGLEKDTKLSRTTVIKWLKLILKEEIISKRKIGRSNLLRLNNEKFIVKEIKRFNILLSLKNIRNLPGKSEIYLFGSCARGEYFEDSDIDIILIGDIKRSDIVNFLENLSKQIKRQINFRIFSQREWSSLRKKDKPFYDRVEKDKIRLR